MISYYWNERKSNNAGLAKARNDRMLVKTPNPEFTFQFWRSERVDRSSRNAAEVHSLTPIRSGQDCVSLRLACLTHLLDWSVCDPGQDSQRLPELESKFRSVARNTVKNPIPDQHSCSEMLWDYYIKSVTLVCEESDGLACEQILQSFEMSSI